jgi:hypothetical protein
MVPSWTDGIVRAAAGARDVQPYDLPCPRGGLPLLSATCQLISK